MELRIVTMPVELREVDGHPVVEGYAAVFNRESDDLGGWQEVIEPGAFAGVLTDDVRSLWQHSPLHVLGRLRSGTLSIWEDEIGLQYRVAPPDAQWARDALVTIKRGDVDQSSFAFSVLPDGERWMLDESGRVIRHIVRVARLYDVSPVTFPAYPETSVDVRSKIDELRAQLGNKTAEQAAELTVRARQNAERQRVLHLYGG